MLMDDGADAGVRIDDLAAFEPQRLARRQAQGRHAPVVGAHGHRRQTLMDRHVEGRLIGAERPADLGSRRRRQRQDQSRQARDFAARPDDGADAQAGLVGQLPRLRLAEQGAQILHVEGVIGQRRLGLDIGLEALGRRIEGRRLKDHVAHVAGQGRAGSIVQQTSEGHEPLHHRMRRPSAPDRRIDGGHPVLGQKGAHCRFGVDHEGHRTLEHGPQRGDEGRNVGRVVARRITDDDIAVRQGRKPASDLERLGQPVQIVRPNRALFHDLSARPSDRRTGRTDTGCRSGRARPRGGAGR